MLIKVLAINYRSNPLQVCLCLMNLSVCLVRWNNLLTCAFNSMDSVITGWTVPLKHSARQVCLCVISARYSGWCFNPLDCAFKTLSEASLFIFNKPLGIPDGVSTCWTVPLKPSLRQVCLSLISLSVFWMVFQPAGLCLSNPL